MRAFLMILMLCGWAAPVFAQAEAVGREMRALEIEQQARERGRWLDDARIFYFTDMDLDPRISEEQAEDVEKMAGPWMRHFLNLKEMDGLCGHVRAVLQSEGTVSPEIVCQVKDGSLRIYFGM